MGIEEILELLEIDSTDQFEYFEHFAELIECTEEISYEAFYSLLKDIDPALLSELLNEYFEEIIQGIPDDATDFHVLMMTILQQLSGFAAEEINTESRRLFIEELFRFRNWYTFDSQVPCTHRLDQRVDTLPAAEALSLYRMEKLGEASCSFDFSQALNYPIEEYSISFAYQLDKEGAGEIEENSLEEEGEDEYADAFIDAEHPVIDGDFIDIDEEDPLL